jgi:hypothetical protein
LLANGQIVEVVEETKIEPSKVQNKLLQNFSYELEKPMQFSIPVPRRVARILIIIFSPLNCILIYLIFKYAIISQAPGSGFFISTVGVMLSAAQMLLFLDLLPQPLHSRRTYQWAEFPFLLIIIIGFAVCLLWIGLGPIDHEFTTKLGGVEVSLPERFGKISSRILFTIFGLIISRLAIKFALHRPRVLLGLEPEPVEEGSHEE